MYHTYGERFDFSSNRNPLNYVRLERSHLIGAAREPKSSNFIL